jgi:hypothetical protein
LGGLISTYLGWQHTNTFRRIGAMSSSYQVCFPVTAPDTKRNARFYVDSGDTGDGLANTITERDEFLRNGYVFNVDFDHTIGYSHSHSEFFWDRRLPRCFTFLFPITDEPNAILTTAYPPHITDLQITGSSNTVTWTAYRLRSYALEGSTAVTYQTGMPWNNLFTTPLPEALPWNYPHVTTANLYRFFRVREHAAFNGAD